MIRLPNSTVTGILALGLAAGLANSVRADDPPGDEKLKSLIKTVAEQEALFANCEMVATQEYKLLRPVEPDELGGLSLSGKETLRIIHQGELRFVLHSIKAICLDGTRVYRSSVSAFDGEQTRQIEKGETATVQKGFKVSPHSIRPHMFLLSRHYQQSLSKNLSQTEAGEDRVQVVTVLENEGVDGLDCVKVKIETREIGQEPQTIRYLWLATKRNYFPVKSTASFHDGVPIEECAVLKWRKLKPGVWMPAKMEIVVNYLDDQGKLARSNRTEYQMTKIDLKPGYPCEFFQKPELPAPTPKSEPSK